MSAVAARIFDTPPAAGPAGPAVYTVAQLAARWGVAAGAVYRMVAAGDLPSFRVGTGRGRVRVAAAAVLAREAGRKAPPAPAARPRRAGPGPRLVFMGDD